MEATKLVPGKLAVQDTVVQPRIRLSWQDKFYRAFCYVISTIWVGVVIFPLVWLISSTFKDSVDVMKMPPDFLPKPPLSYVVRLDFSAAAAKDPANLEQTIKEGLAIAIWRVPDYLGPIRFAKITGEAYVNGKKVGEESLNSIDYGEYRGRLWATQRLSDRLVKREINKALAYSNLKINLDGSLPAVNLGAAGEFTPKIEKMFGGEVKPDATLMGVGASNYWPGMINNFITAWRAPGQRIKGMTFAGYMANSAIITLSAILLQFIISGAAAYALSRMVSPRWSRILTMFFLITLMVPGIATLIPTFAMVGRMGMMDKLWGVILPGIPNAFAIYLFKGFFDALPSELFDAARIDGASEYQTFARLAIPMSKNVFAVIGLLTFLGAWNDFFWPYLILRSPKNWTFPIAIYMSAGGSGAASAAYGVAMASSVIAALPTLVVFAIFSRSIQQGLVWSGLKG